MRSRAMSVLVSVSFLAIVACGGGDDGSVTEPPDDGENGNGDPAGDVAEEMTIEDNAFVDPDGGRNENASVTIAVGEAVRWTYDASESATHTVTSGEGQAGDAGDGLPDGASQSEALNSGSMSPGDTFTHTFETAGTWTYYCEVHPGVMIESTVVVE